MHQGQVELDDIGTDDVQQGKGVQIGAHVVEGDGESVRVQGGDFAQQGGRIGEQAAFGDFEDQLQAFGASRQHFIVCPRDVGGDGFAVEEQHRVRGKSGSQCRFDRRVDAQPVQLRLPAGGRRACQHRQSAAQIVDLVPSRQRLVPHDRFLG